MTHPLTIVEVSARDGIQNEPELLPTDVKTELVERAVAAGLHRLEVASFVNPKRVPQMADAEAVLAALPRRDDVSYIGLVMNDRGFDRALAAGVGEVNFVIVASDTFNMRNQGVPTAESLRAFLSLAERAHAARLPIGVTIGASFGCPFEGEVPVARLVELVRAIAPARPSEVALADTIGCAVPADVRTRVAAVREALGDGARLRCHFHNTRNTGIANAFAAYEAGVDALDASIGGIGGCPFAPAATGNIATEDLLYLLHRSGVETGVDLAKVIETAGWLGERLGRAVPGMLAKAGVFPRKDAAGPLRR